MLGLLLGWLLGWRIIGYTFLMRFNSNISQDPRYVFQIHLRKIHRPSSPFNFFLVYMSPKIPANVLRRFFIVSSPSSVPPPDPSWACCDELRVKKERANDPAVTGVPSSVPRRVRNGLPPPKTSRDDCCCNDAGWEAEPTDPVSSPARAGGIAELLRSISAGDSGRLPLVIEWRDWAFGIDAGPALGPAGIPGGRHWVCTLFSER